MEEIKDWIDKIGYYDRTKYDKVRLLTYGDWGSGKTRLAATFPKPFFIDSDDGGKTLGKLHIPHLVLRPEEKTFDIIMDVLKSLRLKTKPFDTLDIQTVVFDGLTSLNRMLLWESMWYFISDPNAKKKRMKLDINKQKPQYDHWGELLNRYITIIQAAQSTNLNVVATAGAKLDKDERSGEFVGGPNIQGQYQYRIGHDFDDIYFMTVEGSKYMTYTRQHGRYPAKTRSDRIKAIPVKVENPTYEILFGGQNE
ncbi:hypothetical protein LCGC14_1657920 [marine sediment metagenome]|uniref:Uncharacterized protein n=1 Tax=marine sediment metagenome TaxID=412755 RepID=A0A0F9IHE3_9ZZZZ